MPVLSDGGIARAIAAGDLRIDPFEPKNVTPNGVDLRVAEVARPDASGTPTAKDGVARIGPKERFLVSTTEVVTLGPALTAQLWIRSSYARRGVVAAFGKVEAGFSGTLTIGAYNASDAPLEVPIGDRFCQIAFETMDAPAERLYAQRSGNYQGQRGVTHARDRP